MRYNKDNPLRVMTLASGYDSQCLALERLKRNFPDFDYELVAWAEFDPESTAPIDKQPAVIAHKALFPQWADRNYGDITKIEWEKVPDFDLLFQSTPCFVAGTLILTSEGYKPIEEIKVGDRVLTHTNTFKKITDVGRKMYNGNMVKIWGMGTDIIYCTEDHPFYVRRMYKKGHDSERCFHEPEWIKAKNLDKNTYLGYAINQKSELPRWEYEKSIREKEKDVQDVNSMLKNVSFWYLLGRYVGDGWYREDTHNSIIIACSERNKNSLLEAIESLGINFSVSKERTCDRVTIYGKEYVAFVKRYGKGASEKKIDIETLSLPINLLESFLKGYVDSDGCFDGTYYKTSSVSRGLCFGIAQCVAKVYHRPFSIYRIARPNTAIIEGRVVNQKDDYHVFWKQTIDKQDQAFFEDGYVWYPLSKLPVIQEDNVEVFNMSVEEDESYTANGAIVHNCQSISAAGLQHGFAKGSGTRSSIIWNVHDCVRIKRPKFVCSENVSAILSDKFLPLLQLWMQEMENMGYVNFLPPEYPLPDGGHTKNGCMNAKHYGVPQNRERWFMVSILRTEEEPNPVYHFPKPFKLEKCLADVLEEDVDESLFLSDDMLARFCEKSLEQEEGGVQEEASDDFEDFFVGG